jgi:hypothetical protein
MRRLLVPAAAMFMLLLASTAQAQIVRLAWDPSPDTSVTGYILEYGTASRQYQNRVTVGNVTSYGLQGLPIGQTYYFAVRAVNAAGMQSAPSGEISTTVAQWLGKLPGWSDLIWRNTNGTIARWILNGVNQVSGLSVGPGNVADTNWQIVGVGDFNADGESDIVWQHTNGSFAVWLMRGPALLEGRFFTPGQVAPAWHIATIADLDGDGSPDLVWRNTTDGSVAVWYMSGTTMRQSRLLSPSVVADQNWVIVGSGDFNADGRVDLLWRHNQTGQLAAWLMNSYQQLAGVYLSPSTISDRNWRIAAVVDINGDWKADIVWQHTDGHLAAWLMNGTTLITGTGLIPGQVPDTNWRIVTGR